MFSKWRFLEGNFQFALTLACRFFLRKISTINYTTGKYLQYKPRIISIFNLIAFSFFSRPAQAILELLTIEL